MSLADLDANPIERPRDTIDLCLDPEMVARVADLTTQRDLLMQAFGAGPRKNGAGLPPRVREIDEELADLIPRMEARSGTLGLRATPTNGEWLQFLDANPPRPKDTPGRERDDEWADGRCDVDALVAKLGEFAATWDDEPLEPGRWERTFAPAIALPDAYATAHKVVAMYSDAVDFRFLRSALSSSQTQLRASAEPETGESPPDA